ncbi:MAG: hypothetical protein HQM06_04230 [Magnetococcales bacterium]|nr:hypothetical protein [Magnetococcales bacterium]
MEDWQLSSSRRHGNGLLDRLASQAVSRQVPSPVWHVRNRWSSQKPGHVYPALPGANGADRHVERSAIG